jgi:hypothetical protein
MKKTIHILIAIIVFLPLGCESEKARELRQEQKCEFAVHNGNIRKLAREFEKFPCKGVLDAVNGHGQQLRTLVAKCGDTLKEDVENFDAKMIMIDAVLARVKKLAATPGKTLTPDKAISFSTVCQETTILCFMTETWALRVEVPSPKSTLETGKWLTPKSIEFLTGDNLSKYVRPPGGPPMPPPPAGAVTKATAVEGLVVLVREHHKAREPEGYVVASFSRFKADGKVYAPALSVTLITKGPYP